MYMHILTICPCFALFFISTISFFSCVCRPCLSLSISLIDLSIILLFSLKSSALQIQNIIQIQSFPQTWYWQLTSELITILTIHFNRTLATNLRPQMYQNFGLVLLLELFHLRWDLFDEEAREVSCDLYWVYFSLERFMKTQIIQFHWKDEFLIGEFTSHFKSETD